ncbi:hypothetical protein ES703_11487 [subsurface metagenome]
MLLGLSNHLFIFGLAGIRRSGGGRPPIFLSFWWVGARDIPIVVEALLRLVDYILAVAICYHHIDDHITFFVRVVDQKDIVGKVKLVIGIA